MTYEQIYKSESFGVLSLGIEINVSSPLGKTSRLTDATYRAADLIEQAITRDYYADNAEAQERARVERVSLLACFPEANIFVQTIPNGYCSRACCEHLPWFKVTTRIGDITIGWRKRVISIDWSASATKATAEELFAGESTTKLERGIHAWGYDKAREYLGVLFA